MTMICGAPIRDKKQKIVLSCELEHGHGGRHRARIGPGQGYTTWITEDDSDPVPALPESPVDAPIPSPQEITSHERVMARAIDIVEAHTSEHGELWREADATELGAMVRHKGNRVNYAARRWQEGQGREEAEGRIVDSALDCINYCSFIIQLVEDSDA